MDRDIAGAYRIRSGFLKVLLRASKKAVGLRGYESITTLPHLDSVSGSCRRFSDPIAFLERHAAGNKRGCRAAKVRIHNRMGPCEVCVGRLRALVGSDHNVCKAWRGRQARLPGCKVALT